MKVVESYLINGFRFKIICQRTIPHEEYVVKCTSEDRPDIEHLLYPESRFETLSGCRSAILLYLEYIYLER
jgi:hypothetical protein